MGKKTNIQTFNKNTLYIYMAGMLITGTINTLLLKAQDKTDPDTIGGKEFNHPYFQCALMFVGEMLCLLVYCYEKSKRKKHPELAIEERKAMEDGLKVDFNRLYYAIPAICDVCSSTLQNIGLILSAASVYQMMRGAIVVITALFAVIFLKRKLYRHHITGVVLVTIGITIVGVFAIQGGGSTTKVSGIIFLVLSQFFGAAMLIIEEKLFSVCYVNPTQGVGLEGLSGVTYYIVILLIISFIHVEDNVGPFGTLENVPWALYQTWSNVGLFFCVLGCLLSIAFFNFFGLSVTKNASSVARSTIDTSRTVLIWLISLGIGWEDFIPLQLVGFVLLTFGMLLYNEIIVLPFWGFNQYTREKVEKRELDKLEIPEPLKKSILEDARRTTNYSVESGSFLHGQMNVNRIAKRKKDEIIRQSLLQNKRNSLFGSLNKEPYDL